MLEWQARQMLKLGCQRIICLCKEQSDGLVDLQRKLEADGCEFHLARSTLQFVSLLKNDDRICLMADGLWLDAAALPPNVQPGGEINKSVLTIPAGHVLSEGYHDDFERIDAERRWAGVAFTSSNTAQKLSEMPADGEAMSLLVRLSLQAKTPTLPIEPPANPQTGWTIVGDIQAANAIERALIDEVSAEGLELRPFDLVTRIVSKTFAPKGLRQGWPICAFATVVALAASTIASFKGMGVLAVSFAALGALAASFANAWKTLCEGVLGERKSTVSLFFNGIIDVLIAFSLSLLVYSLTSAIALAALPVLFIGIARLAETAPPETATALWKDRTLGLVLLTVAAAFGILVEAIAFLSVAALLHMLIAYRRRRDNSPLTIVE